ncbi:glycoside hydrolase family 26 protein [Streptomyces sp. Ag109_O5-10]|uniref:glycoside hydrolase family 26 protein n=1 Tax=Streptomyces sp. Ag109_O5-10 TaxID=1855349 RepID=UPI00089965B7|nr:glycosyl hydrolase [Streptomyces sp. Ag109_O5-10]SEE72660.1 mannan endo-1,4-beta-mannosidase [Streptomyces sp. Ag109_O5-10]
MQRRRLIRLTGAAAVGVAAAAPLAVWAWPDGNGTGGPRTVPTDLRARDPQATAAACRVYAMLAGLENDARRGRPSRTVIGQHVELQNERYNPSYGDYRGTKQPGYYYKKVHDITGRLPGFVELDLGPGYGQPGWAVGTARSYNKAWPACRPYWGYIEDAVDLAVGVWAGLPRAVDGSYRTSGTHRECAAHADVSLPHNGGRPAGLVGFSFHQPYPGSPVKGFAQTLHANSPGAKDPGWFGRVVTDGTAEHQALLHDLDFLADHIGYLAGQGVPVLLRPYHEMNAAPGHGFWWAGQDPSTYRRLWRLTYDYLVNRRGLHNLLFVWSPNSWDGGYGRSPAKYYPGGDCVDVVGVDAYSDTPAKPLGNGAWTEIWYRGLEEFDRPRVVAESFYVPLNAAQPRTLTRTPWVMWTVWGQSLTYDNVSAPRAKNTTGDVKLTYGSSKLITGGHRIQVDDTERRSPHKA